jgi:hypothetical protein
LNETVIGSRSVSASTAVLAQAYSAWVDSAVRL